MRLSRSEERVSGKQLVSGECLVIILLRKSVLIIKLIYSSCYPHGIILVLTLICSIYWLQLWSLKVAHIWRDVVVHLLSFQPLWCVILIIPSHVKPQCTRIHNLGALVLCGHYLLNKETMLLPLNFIVDYVSCWGLGSNTPKSEVSYHKLRGPPAPIMICNLEGLLRISIISVFSWFLSFEIPRSLPPQVLIFIIL